MNAVRTRDTAGQPGRDDFAALEARYREEQARRLRPEGTAQYIGIDGRFAHMAEDPYIERPVVRDPLAKDVDVVIVGGGWSGLLAAVNLRKAGIDDFRVVETGGDFGGVWYWNRYPGAMCDVESYIYMPLLEELGYIPTQKYAKAEEIRAHALRIGRHFNLHPNALFQTQVTRIEWNPDRSRWAVSTNRGDSLHARFVILGGGPLNHPKLPGIAGIETFKGHAFHTSRWDYGYTGGDNNGNLTNLVDKRVGVIGTGATAIQSVPHLGRWAKQLYVFQRTPSSVDLRGNRPTDPDWAASLEPGWQKRRMENFNVLVSGGHQDEDLVGDGWTDIIRNLISIAAVRGDKPMSPDEAMAAMEMADFRKMNQVRARVDQTVAEAAAAEALKPWYRQFCKRPTFNDDYLPTFNRPNVTLVDTEGKGVDRITETGIVVHGVEYEIDCLIFATGFEVGTAYTRRAGYEIHGRGGKPLSEHWAGGFRTLHGFMSAGFPNCFHMGVNHSTLTPNFPHLLKEQAHHIAHIIGETEQRQARVVEPTPEAEAGWVQTVRDTARLNLAFRQACTPGYYNGEGRAGADDGLFANLYGPGPVKFFELIREWRDGGMEGLEIR